MLLGAAVSIAGAAFFGTLLVNTVMRLLMAQGATPMEVYAYLASPTLTLAGAISLVYSTVFGFICGRVSTSRTRKRSLAAGTVAGILALSFQGVMALGVTPDPRTAWQVALGILAPLLGSIVGAGTRGDA
jgi:hypothetical protein